MELAELLESEGLEADDVLTWARHRAHELVSELSEDDELSVLLEGLSLAEPSAAAARSSSGTESQLDAEPAVDEEGSPTAEFEAPRGHEESAPQPASAAELPPPPEHPKLAEGEPEPLLERVDTRPISLGTPEADALIEATSTSRPATEEHEEEQEEPSIRGAEPAAEASEEEEAAELEIDELEEIDLDELELVEEIEDDEPAPPPPPRGGATPPPRSSEEAPVQTGDTATHPAVEGEVSSEDEDDFDLDFDEF